MAKYFSYKSGRNILKDFLLWLEWKLKSLVREFESRGKKPPTSFRVLFDETDFENHKYFLHICGKFKGDAYFCKVLSLLIYFMTKWAANYRTTINNELILTLSSRWSRGCIKTAVSHLRNKVSSREGGASKEQPWPCFHIKAEQNWRKNIKCTAGKKQKDQRSSRRGRKL